MKKKKKKREARRHQGKKKNNFVNKTKQETICVTEIIFF